MRITSEGRHVRRCVGHTTGKPGSWRGDSRSTMEWSAASGPLRWIGVRHAGQATAAGTWVPTSSPSVAS